MSESRTVRVMCPVCEKDDAVSVTVTITPAAKESGSRETGWSPAEPESIEYEVPDNCPCCLNVFYDGQVAEIEEAALFQAGRK